MKRALNAATILALAFTPLVASAHPLGNFTINHFSRVTVAHDGAEVRYVVDMAEIPAYQAIQQMGGDESHRPSREREENFRKSTVETLRRGLTLSVGGVPQILSTRASSISFPPGQGSLPTLRLTATFRAPSETIDAGSRVEYADGNFEERIGWREIVVSGGKQGAGGALRTESLSHELTSYPTDMLTSPLDERDVRFEAAPIASLDSDSRSVASTVEKAKDQFAELVSARTLSTGVILFSLASALLLGAFHALSPGHGKTIVGAYLVASRATARHAMLLGTTVTISHTAGVFLLGFVTLFAEHYILPETLFPWLGAISGAAVVVIGITLFGRRLRALINQRVMGSSAADHDHHHGPGGHTHFPPDDAPITAKSLIGMGISGGIVPCPSALVVLLGAIALHRVAFGLALIVAFSIGLAGVLVGIGVLMVYARKLFERFGSKGEGALIQALPIISSLLISLLGIGIVMQSLTAAHLVRLRTGLFEGLSMSVISAFLALGFILGLEHALGTEHAGEISRAIAATKGWWRSSMLRSAWSLGNVAALAVVSAMVILFRAALPQTAVPSTSIVSSLLVAALGLEMARRSLRPGRAGANVIPSVSEESGGRAAGARSHFHRASPPPRSFAHAQDDVESSSHSENLGHSHGHDHDHGHSHSHDDHGHEHDHPHVDSHTHEAPGHHHEQGHDHDHRHDHGHDHSHDHSHDRNHGHTHPHKTLLHALGGSAIVMLLVLVMIPSPAASLVYLGAFCVGSVGGVLLISSLKAARFSYLSQRLQLTAGMLSAAVGLTYCVQLLARAA